MSSGFYKRRRGILDHLEAGEISLLDLAVHDFLCLRANAVVGNGLPLPPGVWIGSAKAIHALCPRQISLRAIQRSLEHLEKLRWLKRWMAAGRMGNYPILIARFHVHDLSSNGYIINAEATTDWRNPVLIPVTEAAPKLAPKLSLYREVRNDKDPSSSETDVSDEERTASPESAPPSDAAVAVAALLRRRILENNPKARVTDRQLRAWAVAADRMMRLDGRTQSEIHELIDWSQHDPFWSANILSMAKLREKWDQLVLKSRAQKREHGGEASVGLDSQMPTAADCRPEH